MFTSHSLRTLAVLVSRDPDGREPGAVRGDHRVGEAVEVGGAAVEVPAHEEPFARERDLGVGGREVRELLGAARRGRGNERPGRPPRTLPRARGPTDERGAVELTVL